MKRLFLWLIALGFIASLIGAVAAAGAFFYLSSDLPEILKRDDFNPPQVSRVYASGGELIGEFFTPGAKRTVIPLEEIPVHVRQAFMAAEDADFMTHQGINILGWLRAVYYALFFDAGLKGTSTITQQVVKNLILTPERTYKRKIKEVILSRELERNLTKEDILYLYLNTIYLGHGVNGIYEAATLYFGKEPSKLTIAEGALLAGLTQSPEGHTPFRRPDRALKRRHYVLDQMWKKGFIPEASYHKEDAAELVLADAKTHHPALNQAPFYVEHVRKLLIKRYGKEKVYEGGLRVRTAMQVDKQRAAQTAVEQGLFAYDKRHGQFVPQKTSSPEDAAEVIKKTSDQIKKAGLNKKTTYRAVVSQVTKDKVWVSLGPHKAELQTEPLKRFFHGEKEGKTLPEVFEMNQVWWVKLKSAPDATPLVVGPPDGAESALVSMNPYNRHVVAMIGSFDFKSNKFDHATQMTRQTGSSFKPVVYGAALEAKVLTPASILLDSPAVFPDASGKNWSPKNSDNKWRGPIRVREGLGASRNVIAVRVLKEVGLDQAEKFARRIGVKGEFTHSYTMAIGSIECSPLEMANVYSTYASGGLYGEPIFITKVTSTRGEIETFDPSVSRVLDEAVAFLITRLMTSVVHGYTDSTGKRRAGTAASVAKLGREVAGKTGTTNKSRDAWFVGFTTDLVTAVWSGFDDNHSLGRGEYGGKTSAPIWLTYMKAASKGLPVKAFKPPGSGITEVAIDPKTGKRVRDPKDGINEWFLTGTEPTEYVEPTAPTSGSSFLLDQFGD